MLNELIDRKIMLDVCGYPEALDACLHITKLAPVLIPRVKLFEKGYATHQVYDRTGNRYPFFYQNTPVGALFMLHITKHTMRVLQ